MGQVITALINKFFDCCAESTEHEIKRALGRCRTCDKINKYINEMDGIDLCEECQNNLETNY